MLWKLKTSWMKTSLMHWRKYWQKQKYWESFSSLKEADPEQELRLGLISPINQILFVSNSTTLIQKSPLKAKLLPYLSLFHILPFFWSDSGFVWLYCKHEYDFPFGRNLFMILLPKLAFWYLGKVNPLTAQTDEHKYEVSLGLRN